MKKNLKTNSSRLCNETMCIEEMKNIRGGGGMAASQISILSITQRKSNQETKEPSLWDKIKSIFS